MTNEPANTETPADGLRLVRRAFLLALIPSVVLAANRARSAEVVVSGSDGDLWTIEIAPQQQPLQFALQAPRDESAAAPESEESSQQPAPDRTPFAEQAPGRLSVQPAIVAQEQTDDTGVTVVPNGKLTVHGLTYRQVYDSIPFSRAEYLANPSYRHEATMELLTGVPRQTVIHRTYESRLNEPLPPHPEFLYNRYGTYGGTFGGGYGGFGFGSFFQPTYAPAFRYFLPIDYGY